MERKMTKNVRILIGNKEVERISYSDLEHILTLAFNKNAAERWESEKGNRRNLTYYVAVWTRIQELQDNLRREMQKLDN